MPATNFKISRRFTCESTARLERCTGLVVRIRRDPEELPRLGEWFNVASLLLNHDWKIGHGPKGGPAGKRRLPVLDTGGDPSWRGRIVGEVQPCHRLERSARSIGKAQKLRGRSDPEWVASDYEHVSPTVVGVGPRKVETPRVRREVERVVKYSLNRLRREFHARSIYLSPSVVEAGWGEIKGDSKTKYQKMLARYAGVHQAWFSGVSVPEIKELKKALAMKPDLKRQILTGAQLPGKKLADLVSSMSDEHIHQALFSYVPTQPLRTLIPQMKAGTVRKLVQSVAGNRRLGLGILEKTYEQLRGAMLQPLLDSESLPVDARWSRFLGYDDLLLLVSLCEAKDVLQIVPLLLLFLKSKTAEILLEGVDDSIDFLMGIFFGAQPTPEESSEWTYFTPAHDEYKRTAQAGEEEFSFLHDLVRRLKGAPIIVRTLSLLSRLVATKLFTDAEGRDSFVRITVNYLTSNYFESAGGLVALFDLIKYWRERILRVLETGDWKDLFELSEEELMLEKLENAYLRLTELRMKPSSGRTREVLEETKRLLYKTYASKSVQIQKRSVEVDALRSKCAKDLSVKRAAPAAVIIQGPSGCGKTRITDVLERVLKKRYGIPEEVGVVATHTDSEFQRAPTCILIYSINDAFQTKDEATKHPTLDLLQRLADTAPLSLNGASLEEKEMSSFAPEFVTVSTNNSSYYLANSTGGAAKCNRRYLLVTVGYTEEFVEEYSKSSSGLTKEQYAITIPWKQAHYEYKMGRLGSPEGSMLIFKFLETPTLLKSVGEIVLRLLEEKERLVGVADLPEGCACGMPVGDCCQCDQFFGTELKRVEQGAIQVKLKHEHSINTEGSMKWIAALGAVVGSLYLFETMRGLLAGYKAGVPQETVTAITNVPKDPRVRVRNYVNRAVPWLGSLPARVDPVVRRGNRFAHGVFTMHKQFVTVKHLFDNVMEGEKFTISNNAGEQVFLWNSESCWKHPNKDFVFIYLPTVKAVSGPLYEKLLEKMVPPPPVCVLGEKYSDVQTRHVPGKYVYSTPTVAGDCGLPLTGPDGTVYGIHVALEESMTGMVSRGVSEPLTKEDCRAAKDVWDSRGFPIHHMSDELPEGLKIEQYGVESRSDLGRYQLFGEGTLEAADHLPVGYKSFGNRAKYSGRPSTMFDVFSPGQVEFSHPFSGKATRINGVWMSPDLTRVRAMAHSAHVDVRRMRDAISHALADLPTPRESLTPLDLYRALAGDGANVMMNGRDVQKSIGPSLMDEGHTKSSIFRKNDDGTHTIHPDLLARYENVMEEVYGEKPLTMVRVTACLKDEVLPKSKVLATNKARYFYIGDMDVVLAARALLLPLIAYMVEYPYLSGLVISIDPSGWMWGALYQHLSQFGEGRVFDLDSTSHDLHQRTLMDGYAMFMRGLARKVGYDEADARAVERIIVKMGRYVLEMSGCYYVCSSGLNSGRADTIVVNCVNAKIGIYYAYLEKYPCGRLPLSIHLSVDCLRAYEVHDQQLSTIRSFVAIANTGDDNVTAVEKSCELSGDDVQRVMGDLGFVYTAADKGSTVSWKKLSEISYLQRTFREDGGLIRAPLAKRSIYRSLCWVVGVAEGQPEEERNRGVRFNALREMFMWGATDYESLLSILSTHWPDKYPTYSELERDYEMDSLCLWGGAPPLDYAAAEDIPLRALIYQSSKTEAVVSRKVRSLSAFRAAREATFQIEGPRLRVENPVWGVDKYPISVQYHVTELNTTLITEETPSTDVVNNLAAGLNTVVTEKDDASFYFEKPMEEMSLDKFLARPRLIRRVLSNTGGLDISPFFDWISLNPVGKVVNQWFHFRGDLHVRVVVTGSSSAFGLWRVWAYPTRSQRDGYSMGAYQPYATLSLDAHTQTSLFPHVDIDMSQTGAYELRLPYAGIEPWKVTSPPEEDWVLHVIPINPVLAASGITPPVFPIDVYVSFHNANMSRLVPQSGEVPAGYLSRMMAYSARVAALSPFKWKGIAVKVLELGGEMASYVGFSRPLLPPETSVVAFKHTGLANASGLPLCVNSLAIDPRVSRNTELMIPLACERETQFSYIVSLPTMLVKGWLPGSSCVTEPGTTQVSAATHMLTSMGFGCSVFRYWRGETIVCVQAISSPLVRWRIGVMIIPPGIATPVSFIENGSYLTTVIDIVGTTCTEIRIPYLHKENFTRFAIVDWEDTSVTHTRVVYFPLMTPVGPSGTPGNPYVNLWMKADSALEVGIPSLETMNGWKVVPQSGSLSTATFGEVVEDLLLLTRRATWVLSLDPTSSVVKYYYPVKPFSAADFQIGLATFTGNNGWSFAGWIASAYLGETGGFVNGISAQTGSASVPFLAVSDVEMDFVNTGSSGAGSEGSTIVALVDHGGFAEIAYPDRSWVKYRYTISTHSPANNIPLRCVAVNSLSSGATNPLYMSSRAGDDFRVGGYMGPPAIELRATAPPPPG